MYSKPFCSGQYQIDEAQRREQECADEAEWRESVENNSTIMERILKIKALRDEIEDNYGI